MADSQILTLSAIHGAGPTSVSKLRWLGGNAVTGVPGGQIVLFSLVGIAPEVRRLETSVKRGRRGNHMSELYLGLVPLAVHNGVREDLSTIGTLLALVG